MFVLSLLVFCIAIQTSTAHDYIIGYICKGSSLDREVCPGSYPGITSEACLALDCCYAETSATCYNKTVQTLEERLRDITDALNSLRNTTTAEIRNVNDKTQTLRSDLTTLNGKHNQDKSAQAVINARLETTVAFMARMYGSITEPQTIPYGNDGVSLNIGGGFDASTHGFTAPHVGLYQFTWSFGMDGGAGKTSRSGLHKNGALQDAGTYTYKAVGSHSTPMVTQMALLELAVGDVVDVRLPSGYYAFGHSASEAVFSGSLMRRTG